MNIFADSGLCRDLVLLNILSLLFVNRLQPKLLRVAINIGILR